MPVVGRIAETADPDVTCGQRDRGTATRCAGLLTDQVLEGHLHTEPGDRARVRGQHQVGTSALQVAQLLGRQQRGVAHEDRRSRRQVAGGGRDVPDAVHGDPLVPQQARQRVRPGGLVGVRVERAALADTGGEHHPEEHQQQGETEHQRSAVVAQPAPWRGAGSGRDRRVCQQGHGATSLASRTTRSTSTSTA